MTAEHTAKSPIWGNIETMQSRQTVPGITMWPAGGENLMIIFVRIEPGAELPAHNHPHEQAGTVIEGSLTLTIGDETRELHKGELYIAPPHVTHSAVAGAEGCLVVDIFSPPREDYRIPGQ